MVIGFTTSMILCNTEISFQPNIISFIFPSLDYSSIHRTFIIRPTSRNHEFVVVGIENPNSNRVSGFFHTPPDQTKLYSSIPLAVVASFPYPETHDLCHQQNT